MATRGYPVIAAVCVGTILLRAATISVEAQYNFTILSVPGASSTGASGISGNYVVGWENGTNTQGFLYNINSKTYTTFSVPGAQSTEAEGISGDNIVGTYYDGTNNYGFLYNINSHAFTTLIDPASPNLTLTFGIDGTNIVGEYVDNPQFGFGAFVSSGGNYVPLNVPGALDSDANGIDSSNIVGGYVNEENASQGFLYNGSCVTLSAPGIQNTYAYGINGNNIVGACWNTGGDLGFLYNITSGVYTTFSAPGAASTLARGISGNSIAGYYQSSSNGAIYGFLATPQPVALQGAAVANRFQLSVSGPDAETIIHASSNMVNWISVCTNTPPFTFTDSSTMTFPARYYRASASESL